MRLAVSNIAWPADSDESIAPVLVAHGVEGIEVAPARVADQPLETTAGQRAAYRDFWERRGLPIVAMQSLLFGRGDLTLFESSSARKRTLEYLGAIIDLAASLGARSLVFGSSKNRGRGKLTMGEADAIAIPFFQELGARAERRGVIFCLEPNPVDYGCDFLTNSEDALRFIDRVKTEGLGLNLDAGGMTLAGEDPVLVCMNARRHWRHFHASEPFLAPIGSGTDHDAMGDALRVSGYSGWVSLEMRQPPNDDWLDTLILSLQRVRTAYE